MRNIHKLAESTEFSSAYEIRPEAPPEKVYKIPQKVAPHSTFFGSVWYEINAAHALLCVQIVLIRYSLEREMQYRYSGFGNTSQFEWAPQAAVLARSEISP
jgi:hypothetical protein